MTFKDLNIIEEIIKSLEEQGYTNPTPIQEQAIPTLLNGEDILGTAQTGTGKTAAFAIPIIQNLHNNYPYKAGYRRIKALILSPTRELATQIKDSFVSYSKLLRYKTTVIFGGVSQHNQVRSLNSGVDILVATPGRLLDLMNQKIIDLSEVKYLVLDEADRMLDMGFIDDVNKIVSYIPKDRQTMLFSATLPKEVLKIANELLTNPKRISVAPIEAPIDTIKQMVYKVIKKDKINLLIDILSEKDAPAALVFARTKHGANKIVTELLKAGISASAIHGNKSQTAREFSLRNFKAKKIQALVATDIASRGIDINELSLVINYDLPEVPETYIHRIGRTGRAGREGTALTFCNPEERELLAAIEKHTNMELPVNTDHKYDCSDEFNRIEIKKENKKSSSSRGRSSNKSLENKDRNRSKENFELGKKTEFKDRKKSDDKLKSKRTDFRDIKKSDDKKQFNAKNENKDRKNFGEKSDSNKRTNFRNRNKLEDKKVFSEKPENKGRNKFEEKIESTRKTDFRNRKNTETKTEFSSKSKDQNNFKNRNKSKETYSQNKDSKPSKSNKSKKTFRAY